MIDIHHHCLPDVDDGPREWDESVEMCRMAAGEGIETIIATPHVLRGRWRTFDRGELQLRLEELRRRVGDTPRLLLGSEYFFGHDMADVLRAGDAIVPLAASRYLLVELAANNIPPLIEQPLYRVQLDGWVPILAHPERNIVLQSRTDLLVDLIRHGARTQITAGSLIGEFGPEARRASVDWIRSGLVHFVATDAHNVRRRPPAARAAIDALRELAGDDVADALTRRNPLAVVRNEALDYEPEPIAPPSSGFFTRIRGFFGRKGPTL